MSLPNVLILHTDQHRADCIGAYGNSEIVTPNIDTIAKDGTRFTNHYCPYPVCTPSRYSMLTGLYAHQHLGWGNCTTLAPGFSTFPKELKKAGYTTTAIGKMHFTPTYLDVGFDKMILAEQAGDGRLDDDYHKYLKRLDLIDDTDLIDQRAEYRRQEFEKHRQCFGMESTNLPVEHYSTSWITRTALQEIERWDDSPHLMMVGYIRPHHPFDEPKEYFDKYQGRKITPLSGYIPELLEVDRRITNDIFDYDLLNNEVITELTRHYYAAITQIDEGIGTILDLLRKKGMYENTMIIYTSDHGEYLGYHHLVGKVNNLYEPILRIPLIIKYPFGKDHPKICESFSENLDLSNEILKICGCKLLKNSASDLWKGRKFVFSEKAVRENGNNEEKCYYSIRKERYKLILQHSFHDAMLFDLERDPYEMKNLANVPAYADTLRELTELLADYVLFKTRAPSYLDHSAPVNDIKNKCDDNHREEMKAYFKKKSRVGYLV